MQGATIALMHAEQLNIPNARIENAKLLYRQGKLDTALNVLDPGEVAFEFVKARQSEHRTATSRRWATSTSYCKMEARSWPRGRRSHPKIVHECYQIKPCVEQRVLSAGKIFRFLYETEKQT